MESDKAWDRLLMHQEPPSFSLALTRLAAKQTTFPGDSHEINDLF